MNLGQLLQKILPIQLERVATGGGISFIADSTLTGNYDDDTFKDGLLFVMTGSGLPPQDQFATVTSYVDATGRFNVDGAFSPSPSPGDSFAVADPQYQKAPVLRVVNNCLRNFGIISLVDTSLTTSYNTLEYTLPVALKAFPIDKVEVGSSLYGWDELNGWYVVPAAPGSQASIVFENLPPYDRTVPSNNTLRIWYRDYHPALLVYSDEVSETIPDKRIIDECKLALQEWIMEKNSDLSQESMQKLGILQRKQADSEVKQRINVPNRKISRFLPIRDMDSD